ncbi:MAG: alpha/beta fold hydrolase, partial [Marmoricola sp.]
MPRTRSRRQADKPTASTSEVAVSGELFAPVSPGVELCYQTFGDPDADPLLLVMGLGGPMTWWPEALCAQLARAGFYVIRYDNRDTGRSTRMQGRVTRPMV